MGAYKQFLIEVEELVFDALHEKPQSDLDDVADVTAYVNARLDPPLKVTEEIVRDIMENIFRDSEEEYLWRLNPGNG